MSPPEGDAMPPPHSLLASLEYAHERDQHATTASATSISTLLTTTAAHLQIRSEVSSALTDLLTDVEASASLSRHLAATSHTAALPALPSPRPRQLPRSPDFCQTAHGRAARRSYTNSSPQAGGACPGRVLSLPAGQYTPESGDRPSTDGGSSTRPWSVCNGHVTAM